MTSGYGNYIVQLRRHSLLPADHVAVFLAGSRVRGWDNVGSDVDFYVICESQWAGFGGARALVGVRPETIAVEVREIDRERWDIQYWLDSQVDQVLAKVSWQEFDANFSAGNLLTATESDLLERLTYAVPLSGAEWLARRREALNRSALKPVLVARALHWADVFVEDARGQLTSGDIESAVLSARLAFGSAIRALLADQGKFAQSAKWFARQFREIEHGVMSFDEYWNIETMRTYDPANPARWVEEVLIVCGKISLNVTV
jgi:hypothetical protein